MYVPIEESGKLQGEKRKGGLLDLLRQEIGGMDCWGSEGLTRMGGESRGREGGGRNTAEFGSEKYRTFPTGHST